MFGGYPLSLVKLACPSLAAPRMPAMSLISKSTGYLKRVLRRNNVLRSGSQVRQNTSRQRRPHRTWRCLGRRVQETPTRRYGQTRAIKQRSNSSRCCCGARERLATGRDSRRLDPSDNGQIVAPCWDASASLFFVRKLTHGTSSFRVDNKPGVVTVAGAFGGFFGDDRNMGGLTIDQVATNMIDEVIRQLALQPLPLKIRSQLEVRIKGFLQNPGLGVVLGATGAKLYIETYLCGYSDARSALP